MNSIAHLTNITMKTTAWNSLKGSVCKLGEFNFVFIEDNLAYCFKRSPKRKEPYKYYLNRQLTHNDRIRKRFEYLDQQYLKDSDLVEIINTTPAKIQELYIEAIGHAAAELVKEKMTNEYNPQQSYAHQAFN